MGGKGRVGRVRARKKWLEGNGGKKMAENGRKSKGLARVRLVGRVYNGSSTNEEVF